MRTIRIATRASKLALVQAHMTEDMLRNLGWNTEIIEVSTRGDRNQTGALKVIGGKGLFVREVEEMLLNGQADIAVHSGKDLPYELMDGLLIAGVPEAASSNDCLVSCKNVRLEEIKDRPIVIGTASPRREVELSRLFPNARIELIRGNVDTRLKKLREGLYDATLLAKAGLDRLQPDLTDMDVRVLSTKECIPSACQGILAIECREEDREMVEVLRSISHKRSKARFTVERKMLSLLQADCSMAIGIYSKIEEDNSLELYGMFDGKHGDVKGNLEDYPSLCLELCKKLQAVSIETD